MKDSTTVPIRALLGPIGIFRADILCHACLKHSNHKGVTQTLPPSEVTPCRRDSHPNRDSHDVGPAELAEQGGVL
jgi:hypothetical protein